MVLSRKKRTSLFRQQVENEWRECYWEFVLKYYDKLVWYGISRNPFNYEKELFIEKRMKEYLAAYRIQQYYWKGICNPHCRIGYNKVNRDYDKLFNEDGRIK